MLYPRSYGRLGIANTFILLVVRVTVTSSPHMDSSRMSSEMSLTMFPSGRCDRISGLSVEASILRAKMDIRAPRANRGAGLRGQGCYRPDAVSVRPMGHLSRRSLSISSRQSLTIDSSATTSALLLTSRVSADPCPWFTPPPEGRVADQTPRRGSRRPRRSPRVYWRPRLSLCCDLVAPGP